MMDGTRQLQRFKGITSLEYFVLRLLGITCSMIMQVLARRNAALRAGTTAVGLHTNFHRRHPVVPHDVLPGMVPGAGMLGRITIADNGIRT
jgi:hypothetical protein